MRAKGSGVGTSSSREVSLKNVLGGLFEVDEKLKKACTKLGSIFLSSNATIVHTSLFITRPLKRHRFNIVSFPWQPSAHIDNTHIQPKAQNHHERPLTSIGLSLTLPEFHLATFYVKLILK